VDVTAAVFETYISAVRRPYFAPAIKTAKRVIAVVDYDGDSDRQ